MFAIYNFLNHFTNVNASYGAVIYIWRPGKYEIINDVLDTRTTYTSVGHVAFETFRGSDLYNTKADRPLEERHGIYVSFWPDNDVNKRNLYKVFKAEHYTFEQDLEAQCKRPPDKIIVLHSLNINAINHAYNQFRQTQHKWSLFPWATELQNCSGLVSYLLFKGGADKHFSLMGNVVKASVTGFILGSLAGLINISNFLDTIALTDKCLNDPPIKRNAIIYALPVALTVGLRTAIETSFATTMARKYSLHPITSTVLSGVFTTSISILGTSLILLPTAIIIRLMKAKNIPFSAITDRYSEIQPFIFPLLKEANLLLLSHTILSLKYPTLIGVGSWVILALLNKTHVYHVSHYRSVGLSALAGLCTHRMVTRTRSDNKPLDILQTTLLNLTRLISPSMVPKLFTTSNIVFSPDDMEHLALYVEQSERKQSRQLMQNFNASVSTSSRKRLVWQTIKDHKLLTGFGLTAAGIGLFACRNVIRKNIINRFSVNRPSTGT